MPSGGRDAELRGTRHLGEGQAGKRGGEDKRLPIHPQTVHILLNGDRPKRETGQRWLGRQDLKKQKKTKKSCRRPKRTLTTDIFISIRPSHRLLLLLKIRLPDALPSYVAHPAGGEAESTWLPPARTPTSPESQDRQVEAAAWKPSSARVTTGLQEHATRARDVWTRCDTCYPRQPQASRWEKGKPAGEKGTRFSDSSGVWQTLVKTSKNCER